MVRILVALLAVLMTSGAVAQKRPIPPALDEMCTVSCSSGYKPQPICIARCKDSKSRKVRAVECKVPPTLAKSMPMKMTLAELRRAPAIVCPDAFYDPLRR